MGITLLPTATPTSEPFTESLLLSKLQVSCLSPAYALRDRQLRFYCRWGQLWIYQKGRHTVHLGFWAWALAWVCYTENISRKCSMVSDKCAVLRGHSQSHSMGPIEGGRRKHSGPFIMVDTCRTRVTLRTTWEPVGVYKEQVGLWCQRVPRGSCTSGL